MVCQTVFGVVVNQVHHASSTLHRAKTTHVVRTKLTGTVYMHIALFNNEFGFLSTATARAQSASCSFWYLPLYSVGGGVVDDDDEDEVGVVVVVVVVVACLVGEAASIGHHCGQNIVLVVVCRRFRSSNRCLSISCRSLGPFAVTRLLSNCDVVGAFVSVAAHCTNF